MEELSSLKFYSFGYVIDDKLMNSNYIYVHPVEQIPTLDGVVEDIENEAVDIVNILGENESVLPNNVIKIRAKWLPFGNYNRLTAPDVCRTDFVLLFKFGNSEDLFWLPLYVEPRLRKHEAVTYIYSNKNEVTEEVNIADFYYIRIDTLNKYIRIHTADNDEEFTTYDIEINTKDGILTITDGHENEIILNSADDALNITTLAEINQTTVNSTETLEENKTFEVTENFTVKAKETIDEIEKNKTMDIGENLDITLTKCIISNGSDELVSLFSDTIQEMMDAMWIGNLGAPVPIHPGTKAKLTALKAKIDAFKK